MEPFTLVSGSCWASVTSKRASLTGSRGVRGPADQDPRLQRLQGRLPRRQRIGPPQTKEAAVDLQLFRALLVRGLLQAALAPCEKRGLVQPRRLDMHARQVRRPSAGVEPRWKIFIPPRLALARGRYRGTPF